MKMVQCGGGTQLETTQTNGIDAWGHRKGQRYPRRRKGLDRNTVEGKDLRGIN